MTHMKSNKMLFSLFIAALCWGACSEEETLPKQNTEFGTTVDGKLIPLANLSIRTSSGTVICPGIDGIPVQGVDTARFSGLNYSEDIEEVTYVLPEGATISPIPAGKKDSIEVVVNGVKTKVRDFWEDVEVYTITMADKSTYKIAFKLENFIAQQADQEEEPEPEPDPYEPGTVFIDLFNSEDPVPNTSYWQLCTYANNAWAQHFQHVDGYETVKVEDGYLKLTVKKEGTIYKNAGIRTKRGYPKNTRLEVRAKLTKRVRGGFPAIWQMPVDGATWPISGEIDLMEWVQSTPSRVYQTIHYAPTGTADQSKHASPLVSVTAWHTYAVDRTDDVLIFYVDGQETWRFENKKTDNWREYPFNRYDFDIILNFSLGGTLNGVMTWPGAIYDEDLPGEMWVDWVRITRLSDTSD